MNRHQLLIGVAGILSLATCLLLFAAGVGFGVYFLDRTLQIPGLGFLEQARDSGQDTEALGTGGSGTESAPLLRKAEPTQADRETAERLAEATLPVRDLIELAVRLGGVPAPIERTAPEVQQDLPIDATLTFWVQDVRTNEFSRPTARLAYKTEHAYWWVEEGYDPHPDDLRRSGLNFENITYPTNHRIFGSEWSPGVDGDPHVFIFLGNVPGVGGYFSGPDEYPPQASTYSNAHEMFYINLDNAEPGNDYFDGILAHEFQHMIHWAVDRNEPTWVNEGLSELAAQLNGYFVGGSDWIFSQAPDTQLNAWPELEDSAPHYGASYLFLSYFQERYGEAAVRQLVAEQADGIAGFDAVLSDVDRTGRTFVDLFADWVVANYLDDENLAEGQYGYRELQVSSPELDERHRRYPAGDQEWVHQFGTDYFELEGRGNITVEFTGSLTVPLLGNEVHSGQYQWWSNRGDEGDATLTRAFDLSGLNKATLQAWIWHDLETDYDYAYVEVSADGGETWALLENEYTATDDPTGSSYGPALNGVSGGRRNAKWVEHSFDLTRYAGQEILIRFEVVTDDSVNRAGLALDDIAIPELGYYDDVESGNDGWDARGWVRVTDQVPQEWLVQVITVGDETTVQRLPLDEAMQGQITITGLGHEVERAVLVISGVTPVTTQLASYSYYVTRD